MNARTLVPGGIASLLLALVSQVGCGGGGGGEPLPPTGGAGIPGLKSGIGPPKGKMGRREARHRPGMEKGASEDGGGETTPAPKQ
jgi:hypothetical protein